MTHWRAELRASLKEALKTAGVASGRVFAERQTDVFVTAKNASARCPLVCVSVPETDYVGQATPDRFRATMKVELTVIATGDDDEAAADTRDAIVEQLDAVIATPEWIALVGRVDSMEDVVAHGRNDKEVLFSTLTRTMTCEAFLHFDRDGDEAPLNGVTLDVDVADNGGPDGTVELTITTERTP